MFKGANDPKTKAPSVRNPFWKPKPGDFQIPGLGNVDIGINQLQESGVLFCVCDMAMTVYSAAVAQGMNTDRSYRKEGLACRFIARYSGCTFRSMGCRPRAGTWMRLLFCRIKFQDNN